MPKLDKIEKKNNSRRQFLKTAYSTSLIAGLAPAIISNRVRAQSNTLRIMRWKNFVPGFETWFNEKFITEWGENNNTQVIIDNVGLGDVNRLAAAEAEAQEGHDLVLFITSRALLEDHVIDHREIFDQCQKLYGNPLEFISRSCYNPHTDKYFGFCASYAPAVLTYRKDLWDAVGKAPTSWENIRKGGRAIRLLHDTPVGLSLAPEHNSKHTIRALMYAFGASVQDENGNFALKSTQTLEALKFYKALFEETMPSEVLSWTPADNNRFMLSGSGSLTLDTMSIIRAAENKKLPVDKHLALASLPEGPAGRIGPSFTANMYTIWKFAKNREGAKKFLVDYVGKFQEAFVASGFQSMPSYPESVPDFNYLVNANARYGVLARVPATLTNLGYPGYSNAATDEIRSKGIITKMFTTVAIGEKTPEEACCGYA